MLQTARILLNARRAKMDDRGASAVEYGLLVAGIALIMLVGVLAFGDNLSTLFTNTSKGVGNGTVRPTAG